MHKCLCVARKALHGSMPLGWCLVALGLACPPNHLPHGPRVAMQGPKTVTCSWRQVSAS